MVLMFIMHLRSLVLFLLFLPGGARRSIRIYGSHHDAQQQNSTLANSLEVWAEEREALIPGGFGMGFFRRAGPHADAFQEDYKQAGRRAEHLESHRAAPWFGFGPRRAKVTLQANQKNKPSKEKGQPITFVTGNAKKLQEMATLLSVDELPSCDEGVCSVFDEEEHRSSTVLVAANIDLPELQGEPEEVAREKAIVAYSIIGGPVLVEDSSLCFNALNGLPGVYIKWFMEKLGTDGLFRLLRSYEDKSAYAMCIFAYFDPAIGHVEPELFVGRTDGKIVAPRGPAKGKNDFDVIFEPSEGQGQTYAEMGLERKNEISQRSRALQKLKQEWLEFVTEDY